jgi:predicted phosphodiesterase
VPAWFKLTRIDAVAEEEFRRLFLDVPTGEQTLFPSIRGKGPSSQRAESPGSGVRLPSGVIVHISDLHLGKDFGYPSSTRPGSSPLIEILARDPSETEVGLLIVSGDLTTRADMTALQGEGLDFMTALSDTLKIDRERVIIVPGNHDIALQKFTAYDYSHERPFRNFLRDFYGAVVEIVDLRSFKLPDGRPLDTLSMNSGRLRNEKERNFGYVQWGLYEDLLRPARRDPAAVRLAVLHHHLTPAPREEPVLPEYPEASASTTLDAGAVIEGLQAAGFQMALHGHQHVPALSKIARGALPNQGTVLEGLSTNLHVLGCGSSGAASSRLGDAMRDNCYNLLKFEGKAIRVEARRFTPGSAPRLHFEYELELRRHQAAAKAARTPRKNQLS